MVPSPFLLTSLGLVSKAQILHPYPNERFHAKHPRQEPYAVTPNVGISVGGTHVRAFTTATNRCWPASECFLSSEGCQGLGKRPNPFSLIGIWRGAVAFWAGITTVA